MQLYHVAVVMILQYWKCPATLAMARQGLLDAAVLAKPAKPIRQEVPALAAWALHYDDSLLIGVLAEGLG